MDDESDGVNLAFAAPRWQPLWPLGEVRDAFEARATMRAAYDIPDFDTAKADAYVSLGVSSGLLTYGDPAGAIVTYRRVG